MIFLIFAGIVSIISGIIFLSGEKNVRATNRAISELFNKVVVSLDEFLLRQRVGSAICLLVAGLICLFIAYWIYMMAPPGFRFL